MLENILLLVTLGTSILLLFVVGKESRDRYFKKTFFGYIITSSLWSLLLSIILLFPNYATLLGKIRMTFICWAPYFLILSIHQLFNKRLKKAYAGWFSLPPLILSCLILFTPLIVNTYVIAQSNLIVNKGGLAYLFFIYHLSAIIYQLYLVITARLTIQNDSQRVLVRVIFYSVILSYCLGVFLAIVLPLFFRQDAFISLSPLASVIMGLGISYSVWKYQAFKIRLILHESLVLAISMFFFSSCISGILYILGVNFFHNLQLVPWTMLGAILLTQFFYGNIKTFFYRFFNKDKLQFEDALRYIYRSFGRVYEIELFRKHVSAIIDKIFKPIQQEVFVFPETAPRSSQNYATPDVYFEDHGNYPRNITSVEHDLAISLVFNQKLLGFIFLTLDKKYLNYTKENIHLMQIFARQVSIALANTFSYEELRQQQQRMFQTEKIALLGQLTAGIVHELRNPLTAITMTVSNMKQCLEDAHYDGKSIERLWKSGQNSINEMKQFLENMRSFYREDACNMDLVPLKNIIEEIIPLIGKKSSEQNIHLNVHYGKKIKCRCNAQRIKQALLNLLLNGIEAMPDGGTLSLEIEKQETKLIFAVKDTGLGIPEELRSKIFVPFYTSKKEGSGMGLAIVKEIVELHHGTIVVHSEPGAGTTFTIELPLSQ